LLLLLLLRLRTLMWAAPSLHRGLTLVDNDAVRQAAVYFLPLYNALALEAYNNIRSADPKRHTITNVDAEGQHNPGNQDKAVYLDFGKMGFCLIIKASYRGASVISYQWLPPH
jgi:hypothetical protein